MTDDLLIQRANRVAAFFEAWPDRDEAVRGIADHLNRHWAPRLRAELAAQAAGAGAGALAPLLRDALRGGVRLP